MADGKIVWEKRYGQGVVRIHQAGDEAAQQLALLRLQETLSRITGAECTIKTIENSKSLEEI